MGLRRRLAFVASIAACADAVRVGKPLLCEADLISYALMTQRVCEFNWALDPKLPVNDPGVKGVNWADTEKVGGCWDLKRYNTDRYMTTAVYQHVRSRQCVLAISGYHGGQNGFLNTLMAATQPRENWQMCDNQLHAPVVAQFWQHSALANWSSIAEFLGGPRSTCRDVVVTGESMGGSVAELMVGCGSIGQLDKLQPKELPAFNIKAIYTFGAFATSVTPVRNASSRSGCIAGKRIFHSADMFAQWSKSVGMQHPYMDAMRLYEKDGDYSYDKLACTDPETVNSDVDVPTPFGGGARGMDMFKLARRLKSSNSKDVNTLAAHAIPHYVKQIRALTDNGTINLRARIDYAGLLRASPFTSMLRDTETRA